MLAGIIVGRRRNVDMGLESKNGIAEGGIGRVSQRGEREGERAPKVMWKPAIRMQSEKRGLLRLLRGNKKSNDRDSRSIIKRNETERRRRETISAENSIV